MFFRILSIFALIILAACSATPQAQPGAVTTQDTHALTIQVTQGSEEMTAQPVSGQSVFSITISAFANGGNIPTRYTCSGNDVSPAIQIHNLPPGTASLSLIVEDPDAPSGLFIHWVLYNVLPGLNTLPEGVKTGLQVSGIGTQGKTGFGSNGYGGPCPPPGKSHHYHFRTYALDLAPDLPAGLVASQLKARMNGHILAETDWVGLFRR
jgi:Raf kinase inhibitor-like YbhB/YbcL family protein